MSDFKTGGVPTPDYDSDDINYIDQKTEFSDDVYVYGKLYAELSGDIIPDSDNPGSCIKHFINFRKISVIKTTNISV